MATKRIKGAVRKSCLVLHFSLSVSTGLAEAAW
jgi:hypothetical protein